MTLDQLVGNMIDAGAPKEAIMAAIRAATPPRTAKQERNARYYRRHKATETSEIKTIKTPTETSEIKTEATEIQPPSRVEDNLLTKKISGQIRKEGRKEETRASDFDSFWSLYPNKVGKGDAKRAWEKAIHRVDAEALMSGLRRYVNKTDDRPWCNPATWLNQDRWEDQPAAVVERGRGPKSYATQLKDMVREDANDEGLQSENGHWSDAGGLFPRQGDGPEGHRGPLRLVGKGKGD